MKLLLTALFLLSMLRVAPAQDIKVCIENDNVHRYLTEVTYDIGSESVVKDYLSDGSVRTDLPAPAVVSVPAGCEADTLLLCLSAEEAFTAADTIVAAAGTTEISIYNLVPQHTYYYKLIGAADVLAEGRIFTAGHVRMINAPTVFNIRDLGGWTTIDGKRIKYGLLYRGGELNGLSVASEEDIEVLKSLGIGAELDLRYTGERDEVDAAGFSRFGFSMDDNTYLCTENSGCYAVHLTGYSWTSRYKKEFEFIIKNLTQNKPVYFHCIWGADRTGMLALLLQGLVGVPYEQLALDYELTSFCPTSLRPKTLYFDEIIAKINTMKGETLKDKFFYYLTTYVGVKKADLNYLIATLLEDAPDYDPDYDFEPGLVTNVAPTPCQRPKNTAYDLQGRRLQQGATHGIAIVDGRKVVVGFNPNRSK